MDTNLIRDLDKRARTLKDLGIPTRQAIWLRPSPRADASTATSKIGGVIGWPRNIAWPVCNDPEMLSDKPLDKPNDNYVAVAQFQRSEFPEISFPGQADILHLLWCPRFHRQSSPEQGVTGPEVKVFWHSTEQLADVANPAPTSPFPELVPRECVLRPLRLDDAPTWQNLTDEQRSRVSRLLPANIQYHDGLGTIPGTKLLGYADAPHSPVPTCKCGQTLAHLFTVSSTEIGSIPGEWYWRYDESFRELAIHRSIDPIGVDALDGRVHIFYCETCPERPIQFFTVSG